MVAGEEDQHTLSSNRNNNHCDLLRPVSSRSHVNYSCGSCGYQLNLNSCNRNTSIIGSKYGKSMKKGIISFFSIDESRFIQIEELKCRPFFKSKKSWGLFQRRSKLLCRKCESYIGNAYQEKKPSSSTRPLGTVQSLSWGGISDNKIYNIKICALQPSSLEDVEVLTV